MTVDRDINGRLKPGQKSLNPRGRPKKTALPKLEADAVINMEPYDVIEQAMRDALLAGERDKAAQYALKLLPYTTARLSSVDAADINKGELTIVFPELPQLEEDDEIWSKIMETDDNSSTKLHTEKVTESDTLSEDTL